jgi:hypothetical protein
MTILGCVIRCVLNKFVGYDLFSKQMVIVSPFSLTCLSKKCLHVKGTEKVVVIHIRVILTDSDE